MQDAGIKSVLAGMALTIAIAVALLVRPRGAFRLRLTDNLETRRTYERVAQALARAA